MPLPADRYPHIHFYDVGKRASVKLNATKDTIKFKHGSTKGRGPGEYFLIEGYTSKGQKLTKFTSKAKFLKLKNKGRSPVKSRSSKKMRRVSKKTSRRSKRSRKASCSRMASGKRRSRKSCKSPCKWVKSTKKTKSGKKKKSYCRG